MKKSILLSLAFLAVVCFSSCGNSAYDQVMDKMEDYVTELENVKEVTKDNADEVKKLIEKGETIGKECKEILEADMKKSGLSASEYAEEMNKKYPNGEKEFKELNERATKAVEKIMKMGMEAGIEE